MIRKRRTADGKTRYCPEVWHPGLGKRVGAPKVLGPNVPGAYATEREAKQVRRRMEDAVDQMRDLAGAEPPITVADWIDRWLEEFPRPKDSTNRHNRGQLKPLADRHGDVPVRDFTRDQARKFAKDYPGNARVAKAMWNDAIFEAELPGVSVNPFQRLKLEPRNRRRLALTSVELDALADATRVLGAYAPVMRAQVIFSAYTGLRLGELCGMEWGWLSADRTELTVHCQINKQGVPTATKNGTGSTPDSKAPAQTIAVPLQARAVLEEIPRTLRGPVFTLPSGGRLSHNGHHHHWKQVRAAFLGRERDGQRQAELDGLVWHTLRHTCSTLMAEAGVDRWRMAMQMRHATPQLVDEVYTHIAEREARKGIVDALAGRTGDATGDAQADNA